MEFEIKLKLTQERKKIEMVKQRHLEDLKKVHLEKEKAIQEMKKCFDRVCFPRLTVQEKKGFKNRIQSEQQRNSRILNSSGMANMSMMDLNKS
jgi:hypothetical protein